MLLPLASIASVLSAGVAVAAGLMSIKKIVATKVPGGKGGGAAVPSITVPTAPPINPETALQAGANADQDVNNQVTTGEQTGSGPAVIRAYVVSSEVTGQQEADAKINDLARL